ncbi:MAG: hypothetical protein AVDCRST_MAG93-323 [uncultured Chloroflexia bacterium]|uniref:Uncharacterized protein n=1 Tax=uncultured Chloroflexia bacterium TaxID=1672391 RepID=A0A6J4HAQ1_9CHLR|nr:MAG: hypothetical protein AVDCRST_MAG93-323 [uncultured Chloroflexia bacterium]
MLIPALRLSIKPSFAGLTETKSGAHTLNKSNPIVCWFEAASTAVQSVLEA